MLDVVRIFLSGPRRILDRSHSRDGFSRSLLPTYLRPNSYRLSAGGLRVSSPRRSAQALLGLKRLRSDGLKDSQTRFQAD
jgi:hypothetical protein